jgi:hypothetical protein
MSVKTLVVCSFVLTVKTFASLFFSVMSVLLSSLKRVPKLMAVGMKGLIVAARKRVDGVGRLTKAQKLERDARAQYWMNQRKIERVAEGAFRHGWAAMAGGLIDQLIRDGSSRLDDDGELVVIIKDSGSNTDGEYRLYSYNFEQDTYAVRKILSLDKEEANGSDA